MPKLYSSRYIIKVLEREGFQFVRQRGSHATYRKIGRPTLTAVVPANKKEIPQGTFESIMRQAGLTIEEFKGDRAA